MMELTINIPGLKELAEAIKEAAVNRQAAQAQPTAQQPALVAAAQTAPVQQAAPQAPVQPVPQAPVQSVPQAPPTQPRPQMVQQAVPTTAHTYTQDDLARAAMMLMDSGRQQDLQQLLARFGTVSLPGLPQEQYGAFATALREMGAQI